MKILVGVPTYCEQTTINDAVKSLLQQREADVQVLVSDRSPNEESLSGLKDLRADERLEIRVSRATYPLANFVETGREMLARFEAYDGYAFLAGDDLWSENLAFQCVAELRANNADIATPVFTWFGQGEPLTPLPLRLLQTHPQRRRLAVVLRVGRLQPANLIYGMYTKAAFEKLIELLGEADSESPYAFDVRVALELIDSFTVAHSVSCSHYRRIAVGADLIGERLSMGPPPNKAGRLRMLAYGRQVVIKNFWLISAVLPRPWGRLPVRILLATVWSVAETTDFARLVFRSKK